MGNHLKPIMNFEQFASFCENYGVDTKIAQPLFELLDKLDNQQDRSIDLAAISLESFRKEIEPPLPLDRWVNDKFWNVLNKIGVTDTKKFPEKLDGVRNDLLTYRRSLLEFFVSSKPDDNGTYIGFGRAKEIIVELDHLPPEVMSCEKCDGVRIIIDPLAQVKSPLMLMRASRDNNPAFEPRAYVGDVSLLGGIGVYGKITVTPYVATAGLIGSEPAWLDVLVGAAAIVTAGLYYLFGRRGKGGGATVLMDGEPKTIEPLPQKKLEVATAADLRYLLENRERGLRLRQPSQVYLDQNVSNGDMEVLRAFRNSLFDNLRCLEPRFVTADPQSPARLVYDFTLPSGARVSVEVYRGEHGSVLLKVEDGAETLISIANVEDGLRYEGGGGARVIPRHLVEVIETLEGLRRGREVGPIPFEVYSPEEVVGMRALEDFRRDLFELLLEFEPSSVSEFGDVAYNGIALIGEKPISILVEDSEHGITTVSLSSLLDVGFQMYNSQPMGLRDLAGVARFGNAPRFLTDIVEAIKTRSVENDPREGTRIMDILYPPELEREPSLQPRIRSTLSPEFVEDLRFRIEKIQLVASRLSVETAVREDVFIGALARALKIAADAEVVSFPSFGVMGNEKSWEELMGNGGVDSSSPHEKYVRSMLNGVSYIDLGMAYERVVDHGTDPLRNQIAFQMVRGEDGKLGITIRPYLSTYRNSFSGDTEPKKVESLMQVYLDMYGEFVKAGIPVQIKELLARLEDYIEARNPKEKLTAASPKTEVLKRVATVVQRGQRPSHIPTVVLSAR